MLKSLVVEKLLVILWKPDATQMGVTRSTWFRLAATIVMLVAYSELYEPLGFILATILFGTALCAMLGAGMLRSVVFGVAAGVGGYLLCVTLLDLNLPEGELVEYLLDLSAQEEGTS